MKPYIDFVSQKRRQTTSEFKRLKYKTFSNACFDKFLQNCRNYTKIKLSAQVSNDKTRVMLDRPVYCGFAILESSKLVMYKMFYDVVRKQCLQHDCSSLRLVP